METIQKYVPLNFAILAVPYNWVLVFGIFVLISVSLRLITSDDLGNSTASKDAQ